MSERPVPFLDLSRQERRLNNEILQSIQRVLSRGHFILGPENQSFESEFASYCGVEHAIGVASGTDALLVALRALDVGRGDEVVTVSNTAVATVAAIRLAGAIPVFADVSDSNMTLDPVSLEAVLTPRTRTVIPVHLFGQPAAIESIRAICLQRNLLLVEDVAQAHGATVNGQRVGSFGDAAAFSFYPTKNLGAYGDGGMVLCRSAPTATRLRMLRQYGWRARYISEIEGYNTRLDELQAAILRVKLAYLDDDNARRRTIANRYAELLGDLPLRLPVEDLHTQSVYHLFVIRTPRRDELRQWLLARGIETAIHYPMPIHQQKPYAELNRSPLPRTELAMKEILSLPLYPDMLDSEQEAVASSIRSFFESAP